jgi:hypothetical protein
MAQRDVFPALSLSSSTNFADSYGTVWMTKRRRDGVLHERCLPNFGFWSFTRNSKISYQTFHLHSVQIPAGRQRRHLATIEIRLVPLSLYLIAEVLIFHLLAFEILVSSHNLRYVWHSTCGVIRLEGPAWRHSGPSGS